jgi:hypothetical protein
VRAGLHTCVNAPQQPYIVAALDGRRLIVRRLSGNDGWMIGIKRTKKPIAGCRDATANKHDDMARNYHTKHTSMMDFAISDEGLEALRDAIIVAIARHKQPKEDTK